jgi:hypothetical protein
VKFGRAGLTLLRTSERLLLNNPCWHCPVVHFKFDKTSGSQTSTSQLSKSLLSIKLTLTKYTGVSYYSFITLTRLKYNLCSVSSQLVQSISLSTEGLSLIQMVSLILNIWLTGSDIQNKVTYGK